MRDQKPENLRRGWTTGACATAALAAALRALLTGERQTAVTITLPKGEEPEFAVADLILGDGWAEAAIIKDAGDDPDVTHQAEIRVRVTHGTGGVRFFAGDGVGMVTKPGLPIDVGEPAINPVPRAMMTSVARDISGDDNPSFDVTVSVPGGQALAQQTWNPRLGIIGGISILGTTGIVRPFSCAAWIASIHRGIDVARATGQDHVAGSTGATSEAVVQKLFDLPDHAMLDMGDFAGGMLKYIAKYPVKRLTIGGGIGKMTKLAQGARDLHSGRSQVDFDQLAELAADIGHPDDRIRTCNTALEAVTLQPEIGAEVARRARLAAQSMVPETRVDTIVIDRAGHVIGRSE